MPDSSTDRNYIELDALFKRAEDVVATSVIGRPRRGSGYIPKVDAKIRLNAEVMAWLKNMGPRHYSRINGLLTALMEADRSAREDELAAASDSTQAEQTLPEPLPETVQDTSSDDQSGRVVESDSRSEVADS